MCCDLPLFRLLEEEPDEGVEPRHEDPEHSGEVVTRDNRACAVAALAVLSRRHSSETSCERALAKFGRSDAMVMIEAAYDRRGLRPRTKLRTRTRSLILVPTSRSASARRFYSLQ